MPQLEDLVARIRLDDTGVGSTLNSLSGSLKSTSQRLDTAGKTLTRGVTLPIIGLGTAAVLSFKQFSEGMANVATLIPGSQARVRDLGEDVQDLAIKTGKSTGDLTDGLYQVVSAFGDTADSTKILEVNARAARAGLATTTDAINLTSAVTKAYGDTSAKAVKKASDLALTTVRLGQTTFPELAASVGRVTPLTKALNVSQEELFGTMATFTGVTGGAAEVSTQLRGVLQALAAPTTDAAEALEEAGYQSGEALVKQKGLAGAVGFLTDAAKKSDKPLQSMIGSIEGQTLALALTGAQQDDYRKKLKQMSDVQGTTRKAFKEATTGVNEAGFAMDQAKAKAQVLAERTGAGLAPALVAVLDAAEPLVDGVIKVADAFAEADPATQRLVLQLVAAAAAAGPLLSIGGRLVGVFGTLTRGAAVAAGGISTAAVKTRQLHAEMTYAETRSAALRSGVARLGGVAKQAAGVAGIGLLTSGLIEARNEGNSLSSALKNTAGGAGIGAMFGPIGALVGAGAGLGLGAVIGAFKETREQAAEARIELLRSKGFEVAKSDAEDLAEALQGVINGYGRTARAAVEASFIGEDGKLDKDVQALRDLGVSLDTIVSATMGRANAQKIVNDALSGGIRAEQQRADAAKDGLDRAQAAYAEAAAAASDYTSKTKKSGESVSEANKRLEEARTRYLAAKKPLDELGVAADTFGQRITSNTREIIDHRRQMRQLADDLGLTNKQYRALPKEVRTRVEANGLPQTNADALRLIGRYKELQNFRQIKALIQATDAPLTIRQIETLTKRYNLTPKQVRTLVDAVGVEAETDKIIRLRRESEDAAGTYEIRVHTAYTYSGLKSPTRGRSSGGGPDPSSYNPRQTLEGGRGPRDLGYDYGAELSGGIASGILGRGKAPSESPEKAVREKAEKTVKAFGDTRAGERIARLLNGRFADGIGTNSKKVREAFAALMGQLEDIGDRGALKAAKATRRRLLPLSRDFQRLGRDLAEARRNLEAFEAARAEVVARQDALAGAGGSLADIEFGDDVEANSAAVIAALEAANNVAVGFDATISQLAAAGLSQDALDQLIARGPEAAAQVAAAILAGGPAAIARINALQANIATVGLSIQAKSSQTMYDAGVAAQQGLIDGLESKMGQLEKQMQRIARRMVRAIKKELRIKSPSQVMDQVGVFTGVGFAEGIESTASTVSRAASRISKAALVAPPVYADPLLLGAAARRSTLPPGANAAPSVRVFIGERELTDMVRVEIEGAVAPLATAVRQGV